MSILSMWYGIFEEGPCFTVPKRQHNYIKITFGTVSDLCSCYF